jgi:hypothetical protein
MDFQPSDIIFFAIVIWLAIELSDGGGGGRRRLRMPAGA